MNGITFKWRHGLWLAIFLFGLLGTGQNLFSIEQDTSDILWWRSFYPKEIINGIFSNDGNKVYCTLSDLNTLELDSQNGNILDTLQLNQSVICKIQPDNILYGIHKGIIKYNITSKELIFKFDTIFTARPVIDIDVSNNSKYIVAITIGEYKNTLAMIDNEKNKIIGIYSFGNCYQVKFHPNNREFAIVSKGEYTDGYWVVVIDLDSMQVKKNIQKFKDLPTDIAYSSDGKWLAVGRGFAELEFGKIFIYDVMNNYRLFDSISFNHSVPWKMKFSPNSKFLLYGEMADTIWYTQVYSLQKRGLVYSYPKPVCASFFLDLKESADNFISSGFPEYMSSVYCLKINNEFTNIIGIDNPLSENIILQYMKTNNNLLILAKLDYSSNITISDVLGKIIFEFKDLLIFANQSNQVQLPKLPTGAYIVKIDYKGKSISKKIIVD